ncbi:MAG: ABC-F type ribosomal protection protein [Oscillospiraceae bacterium]|jgi:lincosamide and streptogramin A transport system ATP-binding/permease protein|nr:ABC-F type ribosomal protection protein [Oscillospiraceae bacterium]
MSLINVSHLTFGYDGSAQNIFADVSFQIDTAWKLGFCGRNGRGKTTFLRLLMGELAYSGHISASTGFAYFPFRVADPDANTLDCLQAAAPQAELWELERELNLLDVDTAVLERPLCTLSNGERTKVLLAALFLRADSFLLIDEPTNHLDLHARQIVARYLSGKSGFILVSHDRVFLDSCVDHILSINKTNIEIQSGNFSSWFANKERQDNFERTQNQRLKKEIGRLDAAARRTEQWSGDAERQKIGFDPRKVEKSAGRRPAQGAKSKKMMARSKSIAARQAREIAEKSALLRNLESTDALKIAPLVYPKNRLLSLAGVSLFYSDSPVCRDISFTLQAGDRIALRGKNGSGKSSVLKLLCGENIQHTGEFLIGSGLKISYVPQDASFLRGNLRDWARECAIDETLFKAILRKLDFSREQFEQDMADYSAGQKKKVLLARSLSTRAHLYVWDEPLNYIDVLSRMQIEQLLAQCQPTLLFVEHDEAFCRNIATQVIEVRG